MRLLKTCLVAIALFSTGCSGFWLERMPARILAGGTVQVQASVEGGAIEGLEIVEQAPGEGFVLERNGSGSATVYLAGFEASAATHTASAGGEQGARVEVGQPVGSIGGAREGDAVWVGEPTIVRASSDGSGAGDVVTAGSMSPSGLGSGGASSVGSGGVSSVGVGGASSASAGGAQVDVRIEARAEVPRDGVWGLDGRRTGLTALTGPGVQVDGVRVHLAELEALADLGLPPPSSSRLATDGALEAWAELEHEALPSQGGETHVVVRLRAPASASVPRGRVRVHLVIDRSSSMQRTWDRVMAAARVLVGRLSADDELHIVAYGTDATEALPIGRVGDGRAARAALDRIAVGGGTNIEAGLEVAYRASARADMSARGLVILLSDGVPNHGAFEPGDFGALVAGARQRGTTTSVIGLGTEFDERLLRTIARQGRGGYHVSASLDALAEGLVRELDAHARAAARDLAVRVSLPDGVELIGAPEGEAEVVGREVVLSTPSLDAGEERRLVLRVRVAPGTRARGVAQVSLGYRSGLDGRAVSASRGLELSFGPRAVVRAEGPAGAALIDASLAVALDAAGQAIGAGDARRATQALEAHAQWMEGRVELGQSDALRARVRVVRRLAQASGALVPEAGHAQRRQVGQAFGALAARFAR